MPEKPARAQNKTGSFIMAGPGGFNFPINRNAINPNYQTKKPEAIPHANKTKHTKAHHLRPGIKSRPGRTSWQIS